MSNAKQETIADIVADMRKDIAEGTVGMWSDFGGEIVSSYADRIEAAHQREVAELRELLRTILPYAEAGYCTRKTTHGCTRCPLSSIVSGSQYFEPICRIFKWRKALSEKGGAK